MLFRKQGGLGLGHGGELQVGSGNIWVPRLEGMGAHYIRSTHSRTKNHPGDLQEDADRLLVTWSFIPRHVFHRAE